MTAPTHVEVFLNSSDGHYFGYAPEHQVRKVFCYDTRPEGVDAALDEAFTLLNIGHDPAFGTPDERALAYRAGRHRSLSVGDVLCVDGLWFAVADLGFEAIKPPRTA
uniref:hypothetical protein n=1 Tax=Pseudonocardia sp. CA-138482 TaxID=3240023 RepID=UPI003F498FF8